MGHFFGRSGALRRLARERDMWIVGSLGLGHTRERWKEEGKARTRERHRGTADDHSEGDALAMDTRDTRDTRDLTKLYGLLEKTSVIEGREGRAAEVRAGVRGVTTSETTSDDQPACKLLVQAEVGGIALEEGADQTASKLVQAGVGELALGKSTATSPLANSKCFDTRAFPACS